MTLFWIRGRSLFTNCGVENMELTRRANFMTPHSIWTMHDFVTPHPIWTTHDFVTPHQDYPGCFDSHIQGIGAWIQVCLLWQKTLFDNIVFWVKCQKLTLPYPTGPLCIRNDTFITIYHCIKIPAKVMTHY